MYIHELAKLSGITTRTLRYYDEIGLLIPEKEETRDIGFIISSISTDYSKSYFTGN